MKQGGRKTLALFLPNYPVMGVPFEQPVAAPAGTVAVPSTVEPDTTPVWSMQYVLIAEFAPGVASKENVLEGAAAVR